MTKKTLNEYKKNIFSQYGEDGITEEILRRLGISSGTCVEFGATDGVSISNTAFLWAKKGWKGVLVECNESYFKALADMVDGYECKTVLAMVSPTGEDSIESILKKENVNFNDVKVMSVDIDGDEYHILKDLSSLKPPLLIVEYNPTIPPEMTVVSKEGSGFGSSSRALSDLASKMGYKLVAMTTNNCFFVDSRFSDKFSDLDTSFDSLINRTCLTYLITGYNGSYAFSQSPAFGMGLPLKKDSIEQGSLAFMSHSNARTRLNRIKHAIRMTLKAIIPQKLVENARFMKSYIVWKIGRQVMAHVYFKRATFKKNAKKYGISTFVETGTAGGGTVIALRNHFKKLYTIELDPTLYLQGRAKTRKYKNIVCLEGDSGTVLKDLLKKLNEPALFWLDAHYSGPGTARAAIDTPVVQEIQQIFSHHIKKHVIVIDDMREFNGTNDYPPLDEFKATVAKIGPEYIAEQKSDLLIIEPKSA